MKKISTNYLKLRELMASIRFRHGLFLLPFLLLIGLLSCSNRQSDKSGRQEEDIITVNLKPEVGEMDAFLSVSRASDSFDWLGKTLAEVSWWDVDGKEQSADVSLENGWIFKKKSTDRGYSVICNQEQQEFSFTIFFLSKGDILEVTIPVLNIEEKGEARLKSLRLLPRFGATVKGEEGYLTLPHEVGALCYFDDKAPGEYRLPVYSFNGINMPVFGITRNSGGLGGIITSGQYDCDFCVNTNWGEENQYSIDPVFKLRSFKNDNLLYDDLSVEYYFLSPGQSGWLDIGKRYREYNFSHRGIVPLKDRVLKNQLLAEASQAMEVRLRLGVKPVPYHIEEQTPENEPPVRVFLTFEEVRNIFDEFHRQGINNAEFCLVGWNIGGHDGRYPQILPVELTLGGEEELRRTIAHGQSLGYQVVAHDNYIDAYRIAESWDEGYIAKNPEGKLIKGGQWGGGQAYHTCMVQMYDLFARKNLSIIRDLGFRGIHYTDVLSITSPMICYDHNHPASRRESAEARNRIMDLAAKLMGGIQSEGSLDFAAPVLDRFLYTSIHDYNTSHLDLPYLDKSVPLYASVYHGVMTYNIDNMTVNSLPGESEYLKNIEYGAVPAQYFYGHFYVEGSNRKNWIGNRDYQFDTPEKLREIVKGLKKVYDDLEKLKHLQFEFIEGHSELAEGVYETVYSNGERVVVNYNDVTFQIASEEEVPAEGFKLIPKNN